jgi:hypothetical protein
MAQVGGGGVDGTVLQVDEEEVEAGVRQHLDDLDARHSHQDAEGRFTFPPEHPQVVQRLALLRLLGVGRPLLAHLAAPPQVATHIPVPLCWHIPTSSVHPPKEPYSPKCLEGAFPEVRMQHPA